MPDKPRGGSSDYLSVGESTARTGLSARTLRRYETQGRLTSARTPGGHRRYLTHEIEALLQGAHDERPPAAAADVG